MTLLIELIPELTESRNLAAAGLRDAVVGAVTSDSREAAAGALFIALAGEKADGVQFAPQALANGAIAVVCGLESRVPEGVDVSRIIRVENPRLFLARAAAQLYGPQPAHIVAVTGTDGKTSTAEFTRQLWEKAGTKAVSLGTIGVCGPGGAPLFAATHTTPDPVSLHKTLQRLARDGFQHVAMEASSHGLHQYRLDGVKLAAAAFTNLTRDHLDYHGTEDAYFMAKSRLFSELLPKGATAILNADDSRFGVLAALCKARGIHVLDYGVNAMDLCILAVIPHAQGQSVTLSLLGEEYTVELPLFGAFQVHNMLAAAGLAHATAALSMDELISYFPLLTGVPGRLEKIAEHPSRAPVFVDYAHTPGALAKVLSTLRHHTHKRLHVVFGCGGNRDAGKRPQMGKVAVELADSVIVTDDNPRHEDAAAIRAAILAAAPGAKAIADRRDAIYAALEALQEGDVLVVAGKGHETVQIVGDTEYPFSDAEVIRSYFK